MALSPNYSWSEPDNSSLVKNGAADIRTLGDAIDTSVWNVGFGQAGKNKIINGDFRINQRSFTSSTISGTYGMDRWRFVYAGGTTTFSTQTFTLGAAPVSGYEGTNYARLVTTGQSVAADRAFLSQRIESVRTFAGQTITISFWAKAATGTPKLNPTISQTFGTGGGASSAVTTIATAQTISTSWVRYSFNLAVPSISGKTIGTSGDDHVALNLYVSDGGDYSTLVTAQNNTFDIWGVQAEYGSKATPFQTASGGSPQQELAMCQRYYQRVSGQSAAATDLCTGYLSSTTRACGVYVFPVVMRVAPTIGISAAADIQVTWSAGTSTTSSYNTDRISPNSILLALTTSGLTTGQGGNIFIASGTTKYIEASAEL